MMHSSRPVLQQEAVSVKHNFFEGHVDNNVYCIKPTVTQRSIITTITNTTTTTTTTTSTNTSTPTTPSLCE
jgi:hypothetical protein